MDLKITRGKQKSDAQIYLLHDFSQLKNQAGLTKTESAYVNSCKEKDLKIAELYKNNSYIFICVVDKDKENYYHAENARNTANKLHARIASLKLKNVSVSNLSGTKDLMFAFTEGLVLSNYQFLKYFSDADKKKYKLTEISLPSETSQKEIDELTNILDAVYFARDLVNEPSNYLTATKLAEEAAAKGGDAGIKVEILEKKKIEALKMGGLIAVNKGSIEPPTFTIMEWAPKNAKNKKPYILVGKGLVFDTGGLSLKPTPGSMDAMKSDMGGAAAVIGTIVAIAKNKLPVHVIALIPSTDNRPGENAYAPQDVIKMHNGLNVEVLNTDAEGRMILADALSYAQKYKPELVIDLATLTGAATIAIGQHGIPTMGTAPKKYVDKLKESGYKVFERVVEMPFWKEYGEAIKSSVADIKNVGGREAGSITAGKFLEHFTKYPWLHMDIAGSAYLDNKNSYRGKAGTGVGVRLLFDFFKNLNK